MLRTCRQTSDSDDEQDRERVDFARVWINQPSKLIKEKSQEEYITTASIAKVIAAKEKAEHIERVAAVVESGDYAGAPFGGLPQYR